MTPQLGGRMTPRRAVRDAAGDRRESGARRARPVGAATVVDVETRADAEERLAQQLAERERLLIPVLGRHRKRFQRIRQRIRTRRVDAVSPTGPLSETGDNG